MQKVSVVVTTYNRKYEVRRALESVYAQTVKPFEVILVDDCSNDATKEYLDGFFFDGLKYFKLSERRGVGAARNYGIQQVQGDYIAFLDSDNEWKKNKLEEFMQSLSSVENVDILYSMYEQHINFEVEIGPKMLNGLQILPKDEIYFHNFVDASSALYKTDFLVEIGGFSECFWVNCDWELLLRGRRKREIQIKKVDKVLTENWTMFDSLSEDKDLERTERKELLLEYAGEIIATITEQNKKIEEEYNIQYERFMQMEELYRNNLARKESFYQLMRKWLQYKLDGKSIAEKIATLGYKKIAIYGAGRHGEMLYQDIKNSVVSLEYFIDKNAEKLSEKEFQIFSLDDVLPEVDVIIVSPYLEIALIKKELEQKCTYNIIALDELFEG